MTSPGQNMPFIDASNPLLSQAPVRLETGSISGPQGKVGVLTLRSATTTMTVILGGKDLREWADLIGNLADSLSVTGKVVPATVFDVAAMNRQESNHR